MSDPDDALAAWRALDAHRRELAPFHLRDAFAADPKRGDRLVVQAAGWTLD